MKRSTHVQLIVLKNKAHGRLDRFLADNLPEYSRSRVQQLIRTGFVTLNGGATRARYLVHTGDKIELTEPPLEKLDNQPEPIPFEILFEDKDIIVINKPAGLVYIRARVIANIHWSTHYLAI